MPDFNCCSESFSRAAIHMNCTRLIALSYRCSTVRPRFALILFFPHVGPGRPTIWITVGQGPTALAVGAGGGCLNIFTIIYPFFPLSPSLWETARYRLKYCLKGPLNQKPTNQKACWPIRLHAIPCQMLF